jgi:hypothetical protein
VGWNRRTIVALVLTAASAAAQVPAATAAELQLMASHSAVIFSGQVVAVSREDSAGFVDVRFRIDDAVRGCPKTGFYVLREWAGLWTGEPERYRIGQRRLMLLAARGPSGMSSPVGGMDGAIPLTATGVAPIADVAGAAPVDTALAPATLAADLRWIQARVARSTDTRPNAHEIPMGGPAHPISGTGGDWSGPILPLTPNVGAPTATPVTLGAILSLFQPLSAQPLSVAADARY